MYILLMNMLHSATHPIDLGHRLYNEEKAKTPGHIAEAIVSKGTAALQKNNQLLEEIKVIEREFGELQEGKRIEVSLIRMLEILPRTRHRADAYKGLCAELTRRGVELIIMSNRHKNKKNE